MELKEMQKKVYENKLKHGFNTTNVEREFCFLEGELSEAFEAYIKKHDNLGEELADTISYAISTFDCFTIFFLLYIFLGELTPIVVNALLITI